MKTHTPDDLTLDQILSIAPFFNGCGLNWNSDGEISLIALPLLKALNLGDPIGVTNGEIRFIKGQHAQDGIEVFFRFIPRNGDGGTHVSDNSSSDSQSNI